MADFLARKVRTRQLLTARPDLRRPLLRDLQFLVLPGAPVFERSGKPTSQMGNGRNVRGGGAGFLGAHALDATSGLYVTGCSLGTAYTLFSFQSASTSSANQQCVIDDDNGTTRGFQFRVNNTGAAEFIPFTAGGSPTVVTGATVTAARAASGFTMAATVTAAGAAAVWTGATKVTGSMGAAPRAPSSTIALLNRKPGGTQTPTTLPVYIAAAWSRVLTDGELQSLALNPWQLFEPENDPVFYSLGGGGVTVDGNVGAAIAAGLAANVASPITVAGAVGAATAAGLTAGVSSAITIAASTGAAVGSDYAANVASAITVAGSVGAAVGAGLSASVSSGATISTTTGAAVGAGLAAGVASPITVAASVGAATASGLAAGISTGNEIAAGTGAAVGAGLAAGVSSPNTVAGSVGAATAAGLQATVSTGATIPVGIGAAIALGLTGNVAGQIIIPAGLGRALGVGLQAAITVGDEIAASVGAATAAGLDATIANPTVVLTAATGKRGGYGVQMQLAARRAQIQTGRRRN